MANGIRTGNPMVSIKDVVQSSMKVPEFDKHLKKAGGHIGRNVEEITIKMKTIVRKTIMIKIDEKWNKLYQISLYLLQKIKYGLNVPWKDSVWRNKKKIKRVILLLRIFRSLTASSLL